MSIRSNSEIFVFMSGRHKKLSYLVGVLGLIALCVGAYMLTVQSVGSAGDGSPSMRTPSDLGTNMQTGFHNPGQVCFGNSVLQVLMRLPTTKAWRDSHADLPSAQTSAVTRAFIELYDSVFQPADGKLKSHVSTIPLLSALQRAKPVVPGDLSRRWDRGPEDAKDFYRALTDQMFFEVQGSQDISLDREAELRFPSGSAMILNDLRIPSGVTEHVFNAFPSAQAGTYTSLQAQLDAHARAADDNMPLDFAGYLASLPASIFVFQVGREGAENAFVAAPHGASQAEINRIRRASEAAARGRRISNAVVQAPQIMSISTVPPYGTGEQANFELIATVQHLAANVSGGHYYSFVKIEGQWWELNDSHTRTIDEQRVIAGFGNAVLFFYQRQTV